MKLYAEKEQYKLYKGSMLNMLEVIEPNSIDSIVCDPPYGLTSITKRFGKENSAECKYGKDGSFQRLSKGFMGKEWDGSGIEYNIDAWKKCYEVLKPGGYLLAFGGSRTFHRIACAIEDAGFEIRDTIMWLYGSGFPKSMNIGLAIDKKNGVESKVVGKNKSGKSSHAFQSEETTTAGEYEIKKANNEWNGWGTALKPSYEPIIVARKPVEGTVVNNVLKWGVGGINIDECRVETQDDLYRKPCENGSIYSQQKKQYTTGTMNDSYKLGRFPANTILTYDETDFDEVCGGFPNTKGGGKVKEKGTYGICFENKRDSKPMADGYDDSGSASRYFYCAKASKKDRDEGLDIETEEYVLKENINEDIKNNIKRLLNL
jgi:site-specific DNA-methyltransferase (adenine-specific)